MSSTPSISDAVNLHNFTPCLLGTGLLLSLCPNSRSPGAAEETPLLFLFSFQAALLMLCIAEKRSKMLLPETRSQKTRTSHFFSPSSEILQLVS